MAGSDSLARWRVLGVLLLFIGLFPLRKDGKLSLGFSGVVEKPRHKSSQVNLQQTRAQSVHPPRSHHEQRYTQRPPPGTERINSDDFSVSQLSPIEMDAYADLWRMAGGRHSADEIGADRVQYLLREKMGVNSSAITVIWKLLSKDSPRMGTHVFSNHHEIPSQDPPLQAIFTRSEFALAMRMVSLYQAGRTIRMSSALHQAKSLPKLTRRISSSKGSRSNAGNAMFAGGSIVDNSDPANPFAPSMMLKRAQTELAACETNLAQANREIAILRASYRVSEQGIAQAKTKLSEVSLQNKHRAAQVNVLAEELKKVASSLYDHGDYKGAYHTYTSWLDVMGTSETSSAVILTNRAAALIMLKNYRRAVEDCKAAIAHQPNILKPYVRLGRAHLALGEASEAEAAFSKAVKQANTAEGYSSSSLLEAHDGVTLAKSLERAITETKKAILTERYDAAIQWIDAGLSVGEASLELYEAKCKVFSEKGKWPQLAQSLEKMVDVVICDPRTGTPFPSHHKIVGASNTTAPSPATMGSRLFLLSPRLSIMYARALWGTPRRTSDAQSVLKASLTQQKHLKETSEHPNQQMQDENREDASKRLLDDITKIARLKSSGDESFRLGKYHDSHHHYTQALKSLEGHKNYHMEAVLRCNRGAASMSYSAFEEAIEDCTAAIHVAPYYIKALLRRARALKGLGKYQHALGDLHRYLKSARPSDPTAKARREIDHVYKLIQLEKIERMREDTKRRPSKPSYYEHSGVDRWGTTAGATLNPPVTPPHSTKTPRDRTHTINYYEVLGIAPTASIDEIGKAFRKQALEWHPDKHRHKSYHAKEHFEEKFKQIKEAYDILIDPATRTRYDIEVKYGVKK